MSWGRDEDRKSGIENLKEIQDRIQQDINEMDQAIQKGEWN